MSDLCEFLSLLAILIIWSNRPLSTIHNSFNFPVIFEKTSDGAGPIPSTVAVPEVTWVCPASLTMAVTIPRVNQIKYVKLLFKGIIYCSGPGVSVRIKMN